MAGTRALWFTGAEHPLRVVELPPPVPGTGEVAVRILCCALCSSDLHTLAGRRQGPVPCVLGHEAVGVVDALGVGVERDVAGARLASGTRVVWTVCSACGACATCRRGHVQKCERGRKFGHMAQSADAPALGGLATHALLPAGTGVVAVPAEVSDSAAALASCSLATAVAGVRSAGAVAGACVVVHGAGLVGLATARWALHCGARAVVLCDRAPQRLALAARLCPDAGLAHDDGEVAAVLAARAGVSEADVAFECSGDPGALAAQHRLLAVGGVQVLMGSVLPTPPFVTEPYFLVRRLLTIRGVHNYVPADLVAAVRWLGTEPRAWAAACGATFPIVRCGDAVRAAGAATSLRTFVSPLVA